MYFLGGSRYIPGNGVGASSASGTDPFTGGNRYIPGSSTTGVPGVDPFTGTTRYVPNGTSASPANSNLFPQTSYVRFDQGNLQTILGKWIKLLLCDL